MPTALAAVTRAEPIQDARRFAILIVDDHEVVHWGFRLKLSREPWVRRCLGARNSQEALALIQRYEPQIALVDLMLDGETGADVCEKILRASPNMRVLLMSGATGISTNTARAVGASGFVSKGLPAAEILEAIHVVGLGTTLFGPAPRPQHVSLSERERDVLDLVAAGWTNREIAAMNNLSPHTVKEYVSSVYRKLGARNRAAAVQRGQRLGLLD